MKNLIILVGLTTVFGSVYSQDTVDSAVCKYLVEAGQVDKTINTTTKIKEGEFLKSTNYFFVKKPIIRLSETISLEPVVFGCYRSHLRKNLLIILKKSSNSSYYYYGKNNLVSELDKLKLELLNISEPSLKEEDKAALINYLSLCYL